MAFRFDGSRHTVRSDDDLMHPEETAHPSSYSVGADVFIALALQLRSPACALNDSTIYFALF